MRNFSPKTALITGGSSGIGLSIARQLARQGAHIWLAARQVERLVAAAAALQAERKDAAQSIGFTAADISDPAQAQAAVEQATAAIGVPELVVNSAGFAEPGYFIEQDLAVMRSTMEINYWGTVYITRSVLPGMLQRGSGHVINISSEAGFAALLGYVSYSASKFAVAGFSDALRAELRGSGVRISIVYPPDVDTPQLAYESRFRPPEVQALAPLRNVISPEAAAVEILKGAASGRYVILPGADSKLMYALTRILGLGFYPAMDWVTGILWKKWVRDNKHKSNLGGV